MTTTTETRHQFRRNFVLLMLLLISIAFFTTIKGYLAALFLAAVLTGIVYPVYRWILVRFGGREHLASVTTLLLVLGTIVVPLILFFGVVVAQAVEVSQVVAPWVERQLQSSQNGEEALPEWVPFADKLEEYSTQIMARVADLARRTGGYLVGSLSKVTQVGAAFLINLFVMSYAMFFFLIDGPKMLRTMMGYLPLSSSDKDNLAKVGLSVSRATIKGTLVIGIIQGTLGGLGLAVAGIKGAAFWGTIMVVLSIIPGVGTALVWVPAVIYLLISGHTLAAVGLTIWSAAVVGTVDNVLRPRLVGREAKMPDLLILVSTLGGLSLFGALGLVVGPVIAAFFLTALTIYGQMFKDELSEIEANEVESANGQKEP
ncbi:MAG: AI-2E family transporter [Betaproteobacteria bacterium]|nr:MAG: AI-2E family transporter [Betaproteobacteria bacterium]